MFRRLLLTFVLVLSGFAAGMVLTGRMRIGSDSLAESAAPTVAGQPEPQRGISAPDSPPQLAVPLAGVPDFTKIAGAAVKSVVNISSVQVVRRPYREWRR